MESIRVAGLQRRPNLALAVTLSRSPANECKELFGHLQFSRTGPSVSDRVKRRKINAEAQRPPVWPAAVPGDRRVSCWNCGFARTSPESASSYVSPRSIAISPGENAVTPASPSARAMRRNAAVVPSTSAKQARTYCRREPGVSTLASFGSLAELDRAADGALHGDWDPSRVKGMDGIWWNAGAERGWGMLKGVDRFRTGPRR